MYSLAVLSYLGGILITIAGVTITICIHVFIGLPLLVLL